MKNKFAFGNSIYLIILLYFFTNSCKVDEFKWDELGIKEGWSTNIVVPLFHGNMEFKDFITDWYNYEDNYSFNDPLTTLEYHEYDHRIIPTSLIFDRSVIIDNFPLLIQGNYELDSISLEFIVSNGSPYPLNLELQFFNKDDPTKTGSPVTPDSFSAGNIIGNTVEPNETIQRVDFTSEQVETFKTGNRIQFISWYSQNGFEKDTLSAGYPIDVSIILKGAVKNKNED